MDTEKLVKSVEFQLMCIEYSVTVDDFTCTTCDEKETCEFSYDPYNTDGDCLANK